jgi:hypothetical protein
MLHTPRERATALDRQTTECARNHAFALQSAARARRIETGRNTDPTAPASSNRSSFTITLDITAIAMTALARFVESAFDRAGIVDDVND